MKLRLRQYREDAFWPPKSRLICFLSIAVERKRAVYGEHIFIQCRNRDRIHIREWVEEIAQSFVRTGEAFYYVYENKESDTIRIAYFGSSGVVHLFGTYLQWVPNRVEEHWDRDDVEHSRELRILASRSVLHFELSRPLKLMLTKQNRILAALDKHQMRETNLHPQATLENPNPTTHFDFIAWQTTQEEALYRSTKFTGWKGRKYDSSKRSDFFDCHRLIRFRRNQLLLRDCILKQLGTELTKVGKQFDAKFQVKITATEQLPSIQQLNDLDRRLSDEDASFSEVIEFCYEA